MIIRTIVEIFLIYFLPVILILYDILPFEYRFFYLVTICLTTILLSYTKGYSIQSLGLSRNNLYQGLRYNGIISIIFVFFFFICYWFGLIGREYIPDKLSFYIFYIFISCPLQEFTYRSYHFRLLDNLQITSPFARILFNSITFSFLHAIYRDILTLLFTLAIGILWALIYQKTRSTYGICLSHVIFGTISILAGLV